jgi:c-di-GMP-binding flagellar brake protein YcgR
MTTTPSVLLLHDGELSDVLELLGELEADCLHLRGGEIPERVDPPEKLFIATARHAMAAGKWPAGPSAPHRPYKIGIVAEDSNTLRSMLRRIGFDLLIRRPVHPYALRLLILRALYTGDERRRESRVPVGYEISYRSGVRRKKAMLLELNTRGCRLLSETPLKVGSRLTLDLPQEVTGGRSMQLRAKVIRSVADDPCAGHGQQAAGLCFENLSARNRRRLTEILKQRASGPLVLSKAMAQASGAVTKSAAATRDSDRTPLAAAGSIEDRRKNPRAAYERSVTSLGEEANLVLMGRDLSVGGMRIESHPGLAIGTKIRLAIYGEPREEPFVVRARVVRNDGDDGMGLRFEQIASGVAARLESLVANLPSVESLHGGETDALGSVVSRILESET